MNNLNIKDTAFDVGVNVKITKRNKYTGRVIETRQGHNRCLRMQLMGLIKFLNGEFIEDNPWVSYQWIPRYLGLGTNVASGSVPVGVSTEVSISDTRLLHELSPRIKLPERNKIINRSTQDYIQLVIVTYLPEDQFVKESIGEAGLFSEESGNNCLFRITFDPIIKDIDTVVEVNWTISIISVDSQNQPYEDQDKTDLRQSMEALLDRFAELYPTLKDAVTILKDPCIYDYGRQDVTQEKLNEDVALIGQAIADLADIMPEEDIGKALDEINGEII